MTQAKVDLVKKLQAYRFEHNVLQKIYCSKSECKEYNKLRKQGLPLPDDVFCDEDYSSDFYYREYNTELTEQELAEYLQYKQLELLQTIKNGVMFFVILTVIALIGWLILLLQ